MQQFDDAVIQNYSKLKAAEEIERGLEILHALKATEYDGVAMYPVSKTPVVILSLFQVGLRRTIELTEAAIREINRRHITTAALLSRATIETTCLLWEIANTIEETRASNTLEALQRLDVSVNRAVLGGRSENYMLDKGLRGHHVLDMVRKVSRRYDLPVWDVYERLSECAHPNYHGMLGTYSEAGADGGIRVFTDRRMSMERGVMTDAITVLAMSVSVVVHIFENLAGHLEVITLLSERQIYERGTWPQDVEYPVKRT